MSDPIERQAVIDEIEYELEMINSALDSITLDFNARERLRQRRGEAREILNSIQQLPSAQLIIRCKECKYAEVADKEDTQDGYTCQFHRGSIWFSGSYCSWAERREDECTD